MQAIEETTRLSITPAARDMRLVVRGMRLCDQLPTVVRGREALGMKSMIDWFEAPKRCWAMAQLHHDSGGPLYLDLLQQPDMFFPGLTARPWHDPADFDWVPRVEAAYGEILEELMSLRTLDGGGDGFHTFRDNDGSLPFAGDGSWNYYLFFHVGRRVEENCARCPRTTEILESIPRLNRYGTAAFSALGPNTEILPHWGEHNGELRCFLPLTGLEGCEFLIAQEKRRLEPGRCLVFDDTYYHRVWHRGDRTRLVLHFDFFHPDWSDDEIPIFDKVFRQKLMRADNAQGYLRRWQQDVSFLHEPRWWT